MWTRGRRTREGEMRGRGRRGGRGEGGNFKLFSFFVNSLVLINFLL